jgi:8-oxo-dGTP pyrophosphatase MutT (NUDIX family)
MPNVTTRLSARILLIDDRERLLLYRGLGLLNDSPYTWFTPGGGVRQNESVQHAAARELHEETGYQVPPERLGGIVATSEGHWRHADGRLFYSVDSFFFLRAGRLEVDTSGMEEFEQSLIESHRWWTLPELRRTDEPIIPLGLAGVLERLIAGDLPREPHVFPWHHSDMPD